MTPYSDTLASILGEHFGESKDVVVREDGVSGQRVVQGFKGRMTCHRKYDVICSQSSPCVACCRNIVTVQKLNSYWDAFLTK